MLTFQKLLLSEYESYLRAMQELTPAVQESIAFAKKIKEKYPTVFYVAGPLTGVGENEKNRYSLVSTLGKQCNGFFGYAPHLYGTDPVKHPRVTPSEVHNIDFLWSVVMADFHINFGAPIAHGNAIELAWGEMYGIPTALCLPEDMLASRLLLGMRNIAILICYSSECHMEKQLQELFEALQGAQSEGAGVVGFFAQYRFKQERIASHCPDPV